MEMKFYQEGLDWKPRNISKQGSKIKKDDMGYWNPDNWGEPVEIGSNEITMQGVYEPLLGISDTGDTQMMYPGEDYEFDGESVTEYPVMQPGGKIVPNPGVAYTKKYPPIYLDNPKDPRIGMYTEKGNQYLYKKPIAKESQLPTIYTENPKDKRIKSYQDSLSLYNKFKDAKSNYINTITSKGFNPSYVEEWTTDGYVDKDVNPKIGAIKYGILQNPGGGFDRDEKGNPRYFNYYPTKSGKELKVYLDTDLGKAISTRYPIYKKPVQPVKYKKPEPKKPESKPQRETKKDLVVPISKMETPTALNKTVPNLPYRVDYSGNSQYFASDKEGEEFIKNLNKDFMENKISSPGNVSGYYETKKKKNGGWLEKYK
jgi:YHS domain-containing protein